MKRYTRDELQSMLPEEINANWEDVKASLATMYSEQQDEHEGIVKAFWEAREKKNEYCNT